MHAACRFKDDSLPTMTTNVGLVNIEDAPLAVLELHRIASGAFYAISILYDDSDTVNIEHLNQHGLATFSTQSTAAMSAMKTAGWATDVLNACMADIEPTPTSALFEIQVDGIPVTCCNRTICGAYWQEN